MRKRAEGDDDDDEDDDDGDGGDGGEPSAAAVVRLAAAAGDDFAGVLRARKHAAWVKLTCDVAEALPTHARDAALPRTGPPRVAARVDVVADGDALPLLVVLPAATAGAAPGPSWAAVPSCAFF